MYITLTEDGEIGASGQNIVNVHLAFDFTFCPRTFLGCCFRMARRGKEWSFECAMRCLCGLEEAGDKPLKSVLCSGLHVVSFWLYCGGDNYSKCLFVFRDLL